MLVGAPNTSRAPTQKEFIIRKASLSNGPKDLQDSLISFIYTFDLLTQEAISGSSSTKRRGGGRSHALLDSSVFEKAGVGVHHLRQAAAIGSPPVAVKQMSTRGKDHKEGLRSEPCVVVGPSGSGKSGPASPAATSDPVQPTG
ncbi:hypothetical protein L917_06829 [Phytophthora nicotianae]|uniref:Uncharacterized protein n=2 Tax=Phytophthora nicotianae TaxID=4792 RepID=W2PAD6_PHYN3|nr:hypothetical protein PPTG_19903 [Phytophthora nicotianae INRA-310]ETL95346.1 hypothetical protein L917_06829 [Phytophthora nicotianae]ETM98007.1 hypothetical protein PPTG_19903 [Phytophthora nicotianae INRA-310]